MNPLFLSNLPASAGLQLALYFSSLLTMNSAAIITSLLLLFTSSIFAQQSSSPLLVKIEKHNNAFNLTVNGKPYYIKGAVGSTYMEKVKGYGGNSIRSNASSLDKALQLQLTVLVNLPVKAERDGMDYNNAEAVKKQHDHVMEIVRKTKSHPAVLMWALGNELDFIQANVKEHYNIKVWDAVNALAKEIHSIDPNHPIMTVVGSIDQEKINDLITRCPDLDLLGVNEYGDLLEIPSWLQKYGWAKPYAVTEWGPTGFWQVPDTPWNAPIEETSSMKADMYKKRYEESILADSTKCLGSYVFYWNHKQERTHTWFGMFDDAGRESEAVDVMHYEWTKQWPKNRVPRLDSIKLDNKTAYDGIYVKASSEHKAQVWVTDYDNDKLKYHWEILPEGTEFPYGGNGEKVQQPVTGLVGKADSKTITFTAPSAKGPYRLFVYAYDGNENWATANIPFYVGSLEK